MSVLISKVTDGVRLAALQSERCKSKKIYCKDMLWSPLIIGLSAPQSTCIWFDCAHLGSTLAFSMQRKVIGSAAALQANNMTSAFTLKIRKTIFYKCALILTSSISSWWSCDRKSADSMIRNNSWSPTNCSADCIHNTPASQGLLTVWTTTDQITRGLLIYSHTATYRQQEDYSNFSLSRNILAN